MISVEEAEKIILENVPVFATETVDYAAARERILREELRADRAIPPFDRSMMDGIAILSTSYNTGQRSFPIVGVAAAGQPKTTLSDPSSCIEIMTGAPIPEGADCVIRVEDLRVEDQTAIVLDSIDIFSGLAVHPKSSDCQEGSSLLKPGTPLTSKEMAIVASIGKTRISVSKIPRVAIVATGDELVDVSQTPEPNQIRRSNDTALASALIASGYTTVTTHHLPDNREIVETQLSSILDSCDVLIVAGGISKGKFDYLPSALESNGAEKMFQWVSQRPGKPFWFGQCSRQNRSIPIFALPGNPVSCFSCLHRFTLPALSVMIGKTPPKPTYAQLSQDVTFKPPLTFYLPVKLNSSPTGLLLATPSPSNTSGDFSSVAQTDGFLQLPKNQQTFAEGTAFPFFRWH